MSVVAGAWLGCSSSGDQGGSPQTCKGSPGTEFCGCNASGSCNAGLTCATDLQQCVHLAGATGSGGSTGTGGSTGGGNATGTGGTGTGGDGSGGTAGSHSTGTGGVLSTGGTGAVAGSRGNGGSASGGTTGGGGHTGGSSGSTGTAGMNGAGGSATGGATATSCGTLKPSASGNGEFTHYNFGQGTAKGELGMYQTACGYLGSESGQTDTVMNIANGGMAKNTYFAAIPGNSSSDFNTKNSCGTCVQISNNGKTIIATIIDECPEDSNPVCKQNANGELDLSVDAFNALGFGNGNPSGTSWKAVPCPITGNVVVRIKQANEAYIENSILAITGVSGPGGNASKTSYGSWHFNSNIGSGSQLTLTDTAGRMLQVTLPSGGTDQNQDTGKQFPACE